MLAMTLCKISSGPTNSRMPFCRQDGAWLRGMIFVFGFWCAKGVAPATIGTWTPIRDVDSNRAEQNKRIDCGDPASQDLYAMSETAPLFRSSDSGASWHMVPAPPIPQLFLRKQVMPTSAAELAGYSRTPPKWKVAEQLWF
jgi:hypothetical protein